MSGSQMIASTTTSGPAQRRKIMKHLCFTGNNEVIVESPDITNIKLTSKCMPNNDILDNIFRNRGVSLFFFFGQVQM
jgi:hypothetical protein